MLSLDKVPPYCNPCVIYPTLRVRQVCYSRVFTELWESSYTRAVNSSELLFLLHHYVSRLCDTSIFIGYKTRRVEILLHNNLRCSVNIVSGIGRCFQCKSSRTFVEWNRLLRRSRREITSLGSRRDIIIVRFFGSNNYGLF